MARKPGLTRRQHIELGEVLQRSREDLLGAAVLLANAFPKSSKAARLAAEAQDAVDRLRNELDAVSAQELEEPLWSPMIYYAADREMRAAWLTANPLDDE